MFVVLLFVFNLQEKQSDEDINSSFEKYQVGYLTKYFERSVYGLF